jgi:glycosyltransferase involved in cell wall biosynthesis
VYYSKKDRVVSRLVRREDREEVTLSRVRTNVWTELPMRVGSRVPIGARYAEYLKAVWFDRWVARELANESAAVFIGWSNSSLASLQVAKSRGMQTVVTRGSSHISYQLRVLRQEHDARGIPFEEPYGIEERELAEYEEAELIRIPSSYVRQTFLDRGVAGAKLLQFPYAAELSHFRPHPREDATTFRVLLLNAISVRKGFFYAAEVITELNQQGLSNIEYWLVGRVDPAVQPALDRLTASASNVRVLGRVPHYELANVISQCDVGVFPTIEEGFANAVPQTMACGVPVVATTNSGAGDVVSDGVEGFVVPIMSGSAIVDRLVWCHENRHLLQEMGHAAMRRVRSRTWDDIAADMVQAFERHALAG